MDCWKLFQAESSGDVNFLSQSKADGSDLEQVTPQENTLLHTAVKSKQKEFAEKILGRCPSLLLKANIKGDTSLHVAARIGSLELAQLLINSAKTTQDDVESQQPELRQLLRMVNLEKKETALHVAARNGHFDVVKLFIEEDIGLLDLVNSLEESPLYLAVLGGFSNIVRHILETYPSSPCGGTNGTNALHEAVSKEYQGIIKILVEKRPELIKERDKYEQTPLHYAACTGGLEAIRLMLQCDCSAAYFSRKDTYFSCKDKMTPLHLAAYFGHDDVVEELINRCPYIWELVDEKGQTALHVSVIAGKVKMVKYILKVPELDDLINEPDKDGNTPLHFAALYDKPDILSILARDKRVDKNARNNNSFTAKDIFDSKKPKVSFAISKASHLLERTNGYGSKYLKEIVGTKLREGTKREVDNSEKDTQSLISVSATANVEDFEELSKSTYDVYLVVATLITTVTFAAAFTMPGGYKSNEGFQDQGTANSIDKLAFKAFMLFDIIAFTFSIATVYLLFYATPVGYQRSQIHVRVALEFVNISIQALAYAFVSGLHVMLATSPGFAIAADAMIGFFVLVYIVLWFVDPCSTPRYGLNTANRYCRNKLFDLGII